MKSNVFNDPVKTEMIFDQMLKEKVWYCDKTHKFFHRRRFNRDGSLWKKSNTETLNSQNAHGVLGSCFNINGESCYIAAHRLVAYITFGKKMLDKDVQHIDGDKTNNNPNNLILTEPAGACSTSRNSVKSEMIFEQVLKEKVWYCNKTHKFFHRRRFNLDGSVWKKSNFETLKSVNNQGLLGSCIIIDNKPYYIAAHRLMAYIVFGSDVFTHNVLHIDGDKTNNHPDNLQLERRYANHLDRTTRKHAERFLKEFLA